MIDLKQLSVHDRDIEVVDIAERKSSPDGRCSALVINLRKPIPIDRVTIIRETYSKMMVVASTIVLSINQIYQAHHLGPRLRKAIYEYLEKHSSIAVTQRWLSSRTRYIDIMSTYFHSSSDKLLVSQLNLSRRAYMPQGDISRKHFHPDVMVSVHGTSIEVETFNGPAMISDEEIMSIVSYMTLFAPPPLEMRGATIRA